MMCFLAPPAPPFRGGTAPPGTLAPWFLASAAITLVMACALAVFVRAKLRRRAEEYAALPVGGMPQPQVMVIPRAGRQIDPREIQQALAVAQLTVPAQGRREVSMAPFWVIMGIGLMLTGVFAAIGLWDLTRAP
jgi:hypothetical protein